MKHLALVLMALTLAACKGPMGPEGPMGATGAVGPEGPVGPTGITTAVTEAYINTTVMQTPVYQTGEMPTVTCYVTSSPSGGVWLDYTTNVYYGQGCAAVKVSVGSWRGAAVIPRSLINSGWYIRFVVIWGN